jgi:hypothetical protein
MIIKVTLLWSLLAALALSAMTPVVGKYSEPSAVSFKLAHTSIDVHASSFSAPHHLSHDYERTHDHLQDAADIAAAISSASPEEERELSDHIFHKTKSIVHGGHSSTRPSPSRYSRSLAAKHEDKQFFVHFSVRSNVRTLVALHKFTGHRVIAHVDGGLYVAIGDKDFAAKARRFPGVSWVQERDSSSKLGSALQEVLKGMAKTQRSMKGTVKAEKIRVYSIVAQCWYDGCSAAASTVKPLCPAVYVHPSVVEVHCLADQLSAAVSALSSHIGIDHVDLKPVIKTSNFGGRAILGTGPSASNPAASLVLSNINVSNGLIAVVDSGIDMNNCFFYDNSSSFPWNNSRINSRIVTSYVHLPFTNTPFISIELMRFTGTSCSLANCVAVAA